MEEPRLTIAIPTRNGGPSISETLDTVLAQWRPGVEVLVAENGSTDDTVAEVRRYLPRCPSLRLESTPDNLGFDRNADRAVRLSRAPFVWLLADDDLLDPGAIDKALTLIASHPDLALAFMDGLRPFTNLERDEVCGSPDDFLRLSRMRFGGVSASLVNRHLWQTLDLSDALGTGWVHVAFILRALPGRKAIVCCESFKYENPRPLPKRWQDGGGAFRTTMNLVRVFHTMDPAAYSSESRAAAVQMIRGSYLLQIPRAKAKGLRVDLPLLREANEVFGSYPSFWLRDIPLLMMPGILCRGAQSVYRFLRGRGFDAAIHLGLR